MKSVQQLLTLQVLLQHLSNQTGKQSRKVWLQNLECSTSLVPWKGSAAICVANEIEGKWIFRWMRFPLLIAILQLYSIQVQVLVACLAFLISHSPCHWILFLSMSETKRTSGPKPAASKISQGVACRHKCTSAGTRAAASVLLAEDLVWGRLGHLRIRRI